METYDPAVAKQIGAEILIRNPRLSLSELYQAVDVWFRFTKAHGCDPSGDLLSQEERAFIERARSLHEGDNLYPDRLLRIIDRLAPPPPREDSERAE